MPWTLCAADTSATAIKTISGFDLRKLPGFLGSIVSRPSSILRQGSDSNNKAVMIFEYFASKIDCFNSWGFRVLAPSLETSIGTSTLRTQFLRKNGTTCHLLSLSSSPCLLAWPHSPSFLYQWYSRDIQVRTKKCSLERRLWCCLCYAQVFHDVVTKDLQCIILILFHVLSIFSDRTAWIKL